MPYIAVLVESPAKCGKIEKFLGAGYKCMATFGHIRSLDNLNNIDIENNFKPTFTNSKQTEEEIENEIKRLSNEGFDTVLICAVKGIVEKVNYSGDNFRVYSNWRRFGPYYYRYQNIYHLEGYYSKYKVYHIEASMFNLIENNDKSLVWVASYDIVDPREVNTTVTNYVKAIIKSLEEHQLIDGD